MDDGALWFEWKLPRVVEPHEVFTAVKEGGMGLTAFRLLGEFEFGDKSAQLKDGKSPRLVYNGPRRENGRWNLEIAGFEKKGAAVEVIGAAPYKRPQVYQPEE
ncbi:MAG: hypothetical protein HS108_09530 [Planctomycetes bacterium]|jgi:hypothetical protein|nr:hypothetical protein [Planctomycetota bacterium]MCL4730319.1 hypothetical protein [Planctomycetota bacterium]